MSLIRRPGCAVLVLLLWSSAALGADAVMKTESWATGAAGFAQGNKRIGRMRGRNLLARPGVKVVGLATPAHGTLNMLFDGTAGTWVDTGRVGLPGKPAVVTFYLGRATTISQVGVFTSNSDARANQDWEVRFANNATRPGVTPTFPKEPHLTTGPRVLGRNNGGFYTFFRGADLAGGAADWVEFRIWPTYPAGAGSPGKAAGGATSWASLVELEVWGDKKDFVWVPADDFTILDALVEKAVAQSYQKKATWQDSLIFARESVARTLASVSATPGFTPHVSEVLRGGRAPVKIDISIAGLKRLWLEADTGDDDATADWAVWGDPVLIDKAGKATPLTDLKPAYVDTGRNKLATDRDHGGMPLRAHTRTFTRGLCAPAPSRVCYVLPGKYERLQVWAGIGAPAGKGGSSRFKVLALPSATDTSGVMWQRVARDFRDAVSIREMAMEREDHLWTEPWTPGDRKALALRYAAASRRHAALHKQAVALAAKVNDDAGLRSVRSLYYRSRRLQEAIARAGIVRWGALRLAVNDLIATYGDRYVGGQEYLKQIADVERRLTEAPLGAVSDKDIKKLERTMLDAVDLQRSALLANPLLDFDKLLLVRRKANRLGLPANWCSNSSISKTGYDNEIALMSISSPDKGLKTVFRPGKSEYVGEVDLHFNADKMLFSMPSEGGRGAWQIFETKADGTGLRQVTPTRKNESYTNNYDACYLPDGRIMFTSTAPCVAVPCVRGSAPVATLFRMNADGSDIRQLCFDQEHSWYPAVMQNGRILYTRWEYADLPHANSRMLFTMNPDGTNQRAFYGSNSFWPNSIFYARSIPKHPTKVVGIITGHHDTARAGEMIVFDTALGTQEADGVVQRIPGHGQKVEPLIRDALTRGSWPKFLHPYPLSDKYYLVSMQPRGGHRGIYLVDVFDNMVLIREEPGYALLEPVPFRKTPAPPVVPDKVDLTRKDAVIFISDVYYGPGLKGIPRGEVKTLRLYTYTFGYPGVGGLYGSIGMDGPWDMRRTLGTVPVEPDGSAVFRVPANTPIAVQPLDSEGKAMQIMRSWFTAMPGEVLSCTGCHENSNDAPPPGVTIASRKQPSKITPWRGPARNYEFQREVQPVLDKFCLGCHNGAKRTDGRVLPDLRGTVMSKGWTTKMAGNTGGGTGGKFSVSYMTLHRYVRRPGIESPMPLMTPMEFHADTTELVQMLAKGHNKVKLDAEAWDRLVTWIDFNAPYHGRWSTIVGKGAAVAKEAQRAATRKLYASVDEDHEFLPEFAPRKITPIIPKDWDTKPVQVKIPLANWPLKDPKAAVAGRKPKSINLGAGFKMELVYIPAGQFAMGSSRGYADEAPMARAAIAKGFWMGTFEVTNEQFRTFDPKHDSRFEDRHGYQFGIPGYSVNGEKMPAVRLSWTEAMAFCKWLSTKTGKKVALPTEAQWEWACRAGTATPFHYGGLDTDFSTFANMGDHTLSDFSGNPYQIDHRRGRYNNPKNPFDNWIPQDSRFNDGGFVSENVGKYTPNAWGLHDMHGNVAEWTRSLYVAYPYADDKRNALDARGKRVVRGGSWYDRPKRCTSSYRYGYRSYQKVFNVGFRVIIEE